MVEAKSFESICRLCAKEQEVTIMLFNDEVTDKLLLGKLRKYLLIEIEENDEFSKNICIKCCLKLESVCEFVELVRNAQKNLEALRLQIEHDNNPAPIINAIKEEPSECTEICVDPMDILNTRSESSPENLFTYPYAEEIVTLKLIQKNNHQFESEETKAKKKFVCQVCQKSFIAEQSLKNHSWIHIRDEDYSCFTCQRSFKYHSDLDKHIKAHKPLGFMYKCTICARRFKRECAYEGHMNIHKSPAKAFTCNICSRSYENWAGLKIHNITHSSDKPFHCSLCKKKFKRNQELKFHMNHHTGARPYKCKLCDKCFASTGNLYSHKKNTHKENETQTLDINRENPEKKNSWRTNKFQCYICRKNCGRQENYVYHMFQHTGEKPYICIKCNQKFITKRSLSLHYDSLHPNINKPPMPVPIFCPVRCKWLHTI